jgi:hypothetical protein
MANYVLKQTALTDVNVSAKDLVGMIYEGDAGNQYRYVKNMGSTQLEPNCLCMYALTSVITAMFQKVIDPTGIGATTAVMGQIAGMPMTSLGSSGSGTGEYGWIQVQGIHNKRAAVWQATTAYSIGASGIASCTDAYVQKPTAAATAAVQRRFVELAEGIATTGAATTAQVYVHINCL